MTGKQSPYVKSNYPRIPGDFYPTIDKRCIYAFLEHFAPHPDIYFPRFIPSPLCIDPCAPQGSGIVDTLIECGFSSMGLPDAFETAEENPVLRGGNNWIVSNTPFDKEIVDQIIERQIERLQAGEIGLVSLLLRSGFDFAKSRQYLFRHCPHYIGQIKLLFRPIWIKKKKGEKSAGPIHQFVWHVWDSNVNHPVKSVFYSEGLKPEVKKLSVPE